MAGREARIERAGDGVNAWIVGDDDEVIVIDPGADAIDGTDVLRVVGDREVLAVICTHGHRAHAAAALQVAERDEAQIALHPADRLAWREVHGGRAPEIDMEDGGEFDVAGAVLEVIHAAGHSPGSVCLYCEDLGVVFAGDVLSEAGPVPHDGAFPDFPAQVSAIGERVLTLPPATRVLCGHGDELTVREAERRFDSWVSAGPASQP